MAEITYKVIKNFEIDDIYLLKCKSVNTSITEELSFDGPSGSSELEFKLSNTKTKNPKLFQFNTINVYNDNSDLLCVLTLPNLIYLSEVEEYYIYIKVSNSTNNTDGDAISFTSTFKKHLDEYDSSHLTELLKTGSYDSIISNYKDTSNYEYSKGGNYKITDSDADEKYEIGSGTNSTNNVIPYYLDTSKVDSTQIKDEFRRSTKLINPNNGITTLKNNLTNAIKEKSNAVLSDLLEVISDDELFTNNHVFLNHDKFFGLVSYININKSNYSYLIVFGNKHNDKIVAIKTPKAFNNKFPLIILRSFDCWLIDDNTDSLLLFKTNSDSSNVLINNDEVEVYETTDSVSVSGSRLCQNSDIGRFVINNKSFKIGNIYDYNEESGFRELDLITSGTTTNADYDELNPLYYYGNKSNSVSSLVKIRSTMNANALRYFIDYLSLSNNNIYLFDELAVGLDDKFIYVNYLSDFKRLIDDTDNEFTSRMLGIKKIKLSFTFKGLKISSDDLDFVTVNDKSLVLYYGKIVRKISLIDDTTGSTFTETCSVDESIWKNSTSYYRTALYSWS